MENVQFKQVKNFSFVCEPKFSDADKLVRQREGKRALTLSIPVTDGKSTVFVESFSFGAPERTLYLRDNNFKPLNVEPSDRFNPEVVKQVSYVNQYKVNLNGGQETFIDVYDFVKSVEAHAKAGHLNKRVRITGDVEVNYYNGTTSLKYRPKKIEEVSNDTPMKLMVQMNGLVKNDSLKETENGLEVELYVSEYFKLQDEDKRHERFSEQRLVVPKNDNPKVDAYFKTLFSVKPNEHRAVILEMEVFRGAGEVVVKELSETQRLYISLGFLTEEEAIKDNTMKDSVQKEELRVVRPSKREGYTFKGLNVSEEQYKEMIFGFEPIVSKTEDLFGGGDGADFMSLFSDGDMPF